MCDKKGCHANRKICVMPFYAPGGKIAKYVPVVKPQVFFLVQTLYTVEKSGILNKVCRKLFWQCGRQIILRHRQTDAEKRKRL